MLQIAENEALQDGIHFVRAVAQQSGVFIRHGKTYDFIHPTFREYFAACALESNSKRELYALHLAVDFLWSHERWYEVMLFLLSILSDEPRISDHLVQRVFRKSRWQRAFRIRSDQRIAALLFVAECLIRGVAVDAQTRVEIVKELRRLGNDPRVA